LGALLFALSLFVALGYIYYATIYSELRRVDAANEAEIAELQALYDNAGLTALTNARQRGIISELEPSTSLTAKRIYHQAGRTLVGNAVFQRGLSNTNIFERVYVLQSQDGITGNLAGQTVKPTGQEESLIPELENAQFTLLKFFYTVDQEEEGLIERRARAIAGNIVLNGEPSLVILVGRDVETIARTGERVRTAILTSSGIALLLGLLSSFFVSRRFARRVVGFNRLATDSGPDWKRRLSSWEIQRKRSHSMKRQEMQTNCYLLLTPFSELRDWRRANRESY